MKKLLFIFLISFILFNYVASITCADLKKALQKAGIYEDVISLINRGTKAAAKALCKKKLPSYICDEIQNCF